METEQEPIFETLQEAYAALADVAIRQSELTYERKLIEADRDRLLGELGMRSYDVC